MDRGWGGVWLGRGAEEDRVRMWGNRSRRGHRLGCSVGNGQARVVVSAGHVGGKVRRRKASGDRGRRFCN